MTPTICERPPNPNENRNFSSEQTLGYHFRHYARAFHLDTTHNQATNNTQHYLLELTPKASNICGWQTTLQKLDRSANPESLATMRPFSAALSSAAAMQNVVNDSNHRVLIINGENAVPGRYPYFTTLDRFCAGALIAPDIVLTAGHCKPDTVHDIGQVHVGHMISRAAKMIQLSLHHYAIALARRLRCAVAV